MGILLARQAYLAPCESIILFGSVTAKHFLRTFGGLMSDDRLHRAPAASDNTARESGKRWRRTRKVGILASDPA